MSMILREQETEGKGLDKPYYVRRHWVLFRLQEFPRGESKTQQSHRDSVDVNSIVKRFDRTGQLPPPRMEAQYGDVSGLNRPYAELIEESRQVLDKTGQFVEERDEKEKAAKLAQAEAEQKELAELRAQKAAKKSDTPPTD